MLSDKLGSKTQLSPNSPEYAYLEYGLQLTLGASTARIVTAFAVSNPHLSLQFENRCTDILTLPTWMDASDLCGGNTEEDVIRRGFRFTPPDKGAAFSTGFIKNPNDHTSRPDQLPRKVLLCKLGVGRAFAVTSNDSIPDTLPQGYDSFYLHNSSGNDKNNPEKYRHDYYITDSAQILPQYLIHFDYDTGKEAKSREVSILSNVKTSKCDNCESERAAIYCAADAANLCSKCDTQLHSSKLASRHVRTPIGKGSDVFGYCRHHPEKCIEFYCSQCHIPVCVYCKMVGNHANGEASRHQLVSVSEAYQSVVHESSSPDPILQSRRTDIHSQLASIESRAQAIRNLRKTIEAQIEEAYNKAMNDIQRITDQKMNVLLGDKLELNRQMLDIDRLESFLNYQQQGDATSYLFNWARHQMFKAELHDFKYFKRDIDVQLDAKMVGSLSVVIEDEDFHTNCVTTSANNSPSKSIKTKSPIRLSPNKVNRRTSDLFAETLGALDHSSIRDEDDFDSYAESLSFRD